LAKLVITELLADGLDELGGLVHLIVSDQPEVEPLPPLAESNIITSSIKDVDNSDDLKPKTRINVEFRLPADPKKLPEYIHRLVLLIMYTVDQVSVLQGSAECQLKAQKQRRVAMELIQKKQLKKESELEERKKADLERKKREERENLEKTMSREQKKKLEEREHKKMLKQRVKMVKG
jgi:hypothetical protein